MSSKLKVSIIKTIELGRREIARWREIQFNTPHLQNPFLTPEWALIVAAAQKDARTAIIEDNSKIIGFVSIQNAGGNTGMGLGNPICDYDGIICEDDVNIDLTEVVRAFGLSRIDFSNLPAQSAINKNAIKLTNSSLTCNINELRAKIAQTSKKSSANLKNLSRIKRKLADNGHTVEFAIDVKDNAALEQMLVWKSAQYQSTGQNDILKHEWVGQTIRRVHDFKNEYFNGQLCALRIDGELAAVSTSINSGAVTHAWFTAYDPNFAKYSPGNLLFFEELMQADNPNVETYDFGTGHYSYKEHYANGEKNHGAGFYGANNFESFSRQSAFDLAKKLAPSKNKFVADIVPKIMRRLDKIRALKMKLLLSGYFAPELSAFMPVLAA